MGRPRSVWPPSRVSELVRLREGGLAWREVGERLGLPHVTCARYWREVLRRPAERIARTRVRAHP